MGKALREYNIPRRKVVIMTKCYRIVCDEETPDPGSGVAMHGDLADQSKDYVNQWGEWNNQTTVSFALLHHFQPL